MIYLIDDDKSVNLALGLFLQSADYAYQSFENAEKFLSVFHAKPNDLLVLDMHLPGMQGCDLLKKLKTEGIALPVIIVTANDHPTSRECSREYGVLAFLRKPADGEALIDIIRYHLPQLQTIKS